MTDNPYVEMPAGLVLERTSPEFTNDSVPPGLLRAHKVADHVTGRLVVREGSLVFVYEDEADEPITVGSGNWVVIHPGRPHHVELAGPVRFVVEFHVAA